MIIATRDHDEPGMYKISFMTRARVELTGDLWPGRYIEFTEEEMPKDQAEDYLSKQVLGDFNVPFKIPAGSEMGELVWYPYDFSTLENGFIADQVQKRFIKTS